MRQSWQFVLTIPALFFDTVIIVNSIVNRMQPLNILWPIAICFPVLSNPRSQDESPDALACI
jgi:hypothetical protein